jgi:hypothetical protein
MKKIKDDLQTLQTNVKENFDFLFRFGGSRKRLRDVEKQIAFLIDCVICNQSETNDAKDDNSTSRESVSFAQTFRKSLETITISRDYYYILKNTIFEFFNECNDLRDMYSMEDKHTQKFFQFQGEIRELLESFDNNVKNRRQ